MFQGDGAPLPEPTATRWACDKDDEHVEETHGPVLTPCTCGGTMQFAVQDAETGLRCDACGDFEPFRGDLQIGGEA